jgi:hypothetical protein
MLEDIKKIKSDVLRFMEQEAGKYGNGRMDTKQMGELADIVKDLAEAEYYCTVAEAMGGGQDSMGYTQPRMMGYQGQGMGSQGSTGGSGRQGYGSGMMGHTDPMQVVRDMLASNPELRTQLRNELM